MDAPDRGLALLLERVVRTIYEGRDQDQLHPAQWAALRYFARAGRLSRTVAGLAKFLGITKGPASRSTNRLAKRGYLFSEVNEADRRVSFFTLTGAGEKALEADPIFRLAQAISRFDPERKAAFAACLEDIHAPLLAAASDAESGDVGARKKAGEG